MTEKDIFKEVERKIEGRVEETRRGLENYRRDELSDVAWIDGGGKRFWLGSENNG